MVWVHGRKPASWLEYPAHEDTIMLDAGLLRALVQRGVAFRFAFGERIDDVRERTVLYTVHPYNLSGGADHLGWFARRPGCSGRP